MNNIQDTLTIGQKFNLTLLSFSIGSPLLTFIELYVFKDWNFLISIILLVFLDSVTGGISAVIKGNFSGVEFIKKLSIKMFALTVTIVCVGVLKNAVIGGNNNFMSTWIDSSLYAIMLGFEGSSVLKNCYKIYPWEPIKVILQKLDVYYHKKVDAKNP